MSSATENISRRAFLQAIGKAAGSGVMLKAATAIGLSVTVSGCGSSNASESPSTNTPASADPAVPNDPVNPNPRPVDWPAGVGEGKSVIILGAGIAGMSAAFELDKLGYQCTILEATERAGGRCRTIRAGDAIKETNSVQHCDFTDDENFYFNPGPARIPHHH